MKRLMQKTLLFVLIFGQSASAVAGLTQTADIILKGPRVDIRAFDGDLAAAVGASHGKKVIVSSRTVVLRSSLVVPSDVQIEVTQGGLINLGVADLVIDGPFSAGLYRVFSGNGKVSFGSGSVREVYPEWWGARGDGVTDSSAPIQAAEQSIAASRGVLRLSSGVYIANFIVDSWVTIQGSGIEHTILRSKAHSGLDVIKGRNFDSLTGTAKVTPENRGVNYLKICELTIDGNKENNVEGYGIRIWGKSYVWTNVTVRNCAKDGIWTEFTDIDPPKAPNEYLQALEGTFTNIKTIGNGNNGWTFRGPHDSSIVYFDTFENGGWGFENQYLAGHFLGTLAASANWGSWNNARGSYKLGSSISVVGITASGPGTGIDMAGSIGNCMLANAVISGNLGTAGLILRGDENVISGTFDGNSHDAIQIDGATGYIITATGSGNRGAFVRFMNDRGGIVNAFVNVPAGGTTTVGTMSTATSANITGVGGGVVQRLFKMQAPGITTWNGFTHAVPSNNYEFATTNHVALPAQYTAGPSPWIFQNKIGFDVDMAIAGGDVSSVQFSRDGVSYFATGVTQGIVHLSPGDYIRIVHKRAPRYTLIAR